MNLRLSPIALRPSSFIILLAYIALIVLALLTPYLYVMITRIEKNVHMESVNFASQLQSEIQYSAELFNPLKSSSANLARLLTSSLGSTKNIFSHIHFKVAPLLFQAFETIPHLKQISYMGKEGQFFSYYKDDNDEALVMYSNSSSFIGGASNKTLYYYIQPVNQNGEAYGEAKISNHSINISLVLESFNLSNGFASLGTKWSNNDELLFMNSARVTSTCVISLGFSTKAITDFLTRRQGAISYLASKDGKVVVQGIHQSRLVVSNGTVSFQHVNANGDLIRNEGTVSCKGEVGSSRFKIGDNHYLIHCYPIDIMGIELVHVLAIPENKFIDGDVVHYKERGLIVLIITTSMIFMVIFSFAFSHIRGARREMHLSASLIKQMEATQQAVRKNMNKSQAFAIASHDVRAFLACLIGLIDMSYKLVVPFSELDTNLKKMEGCTKDLLGLLNSILDTSKIEAGKMQLEEEEFEVSHLLEDVVDLYHPIAMKKGVDLVLDPCNCSVVRYSRVKGDRGRLKQVLCNLLSNAVKFTDEGHITVRSWAQEATMQNSIINKTNQYSLMKSWSSCLFYKKNDANEDLEKAMSSIQHDSNAMDFVFEVDDTGKGIPKENYKSVFENYVQVKETAIGQVGTGLGLGIVQSLVRLMHGDIGIVDKDSGEKGTCFRFNVILTLCESETVTNAGTIREGVAEAHGRRTIHATSSGSSICSMDPSPSLHVSISSPKPEPSCVVLYIADDERRKTSQMFMESLGIKVEAVKHWKHLYDALKKIKQKSHNSNVQSSPESSDLNSQCTSCSSYARATRVPFKAMDGRDHASSVFKKTNIGATPGFILIVIDANAGSFLKFSSVVSNFKKDLSNPCKVVWLDKPLVCSVDLKKFDDDDDDIVISKPFHGSRLFQVIELLPEYGGNWHRSSSSGQGKNISLSRDSSLSKYQGKTRKYFVQQGEECGDSSSNKPLSGKKFLVVEDSALLRKIALAILMGLGATFDQCENGEQAVRLVGEVLYKDFPNPPYDYILMDCQMPVMDGFEATRRIREMEKCHGLLHIPIIALTAEIDKTPTQSGMDYHIIKPITREQLLKAIRFIHKRPDIIM